MALLKRALSDSDDGDWALFYDAEGQELYVTCKTDDGQEKLHRVDSVLKMDGLAPDKLRLAIVSLFGQDNDA